MILLALFLLLLICFLAFFIGAGRKFSPSLISMGIVLPIPLIALVLYSFFGNPAVPSATKTPKKIPVKIQETFAKLETEAQQTPDLQIRAQKLCLLAEIEFRTNAKSLALKTWQKSLENAFSPETAVELAEAESENAGFITKSAQTLYAKALETHVIKADNKMQPAWQKIAQMRLMQAEQEREKEGDEISILSPESNP